MINLLEPSFICNNQIRCNKLSKIFKYRFRKLFASKSSNIVDANSNTLAISWKLCHIRSVVGLMTIIKLLELAVPVEFAEVVVPLFQIWSHCCRSSVVSHWVYLCVYTDGERLWWCRCCWSRWISIISVFFWPLMKLKVSVGEAASARATPVPVVYRKCQLQCSCHRFWSRREGGSLNRNVHNSWHTDSSFIHPSIHLWGSSSSVCCMFYGCPSVRLSVCLSFIHAFMSWLTIKGILAKTGIRPDQLAIHYH